ncbi:glutathione S-transferase T3-like [Prunus avium]|uniref:Glutathione S-transferase T3-like n=1 Tax=Prunus avium TaxID=42229 RepID=A0A6P5RLK4_PRUAV|nr:glutathione S-transferase T3-like [Prunus avium]
MSKRSKIVSPTTSPSTPDSINFREDDVASDKSISLWRPIGIMTTENTSDADPIDTFSTHGYMSVDKSSNESLLSTQIPAQIESIKMEQRSRNFSIDEDNQLVSVWLNVCLDADNGDEQKSSGYWKRIWEYFNKGKKFTFERVADSLMDCCSAMQFAVNYFCGCYAQIKAMKQSGVNDQIG